MENENKLPDMPIGIDVAAELSRILNEEISNSLQKAKGRIKTNGYTIAFEIPEVKDKSVYDVLQSWCKLVEKQKVETESQDTVSETKEDVWTTLLGLPQYKFKNLEIVNDPETITIHNASDLYFTFKCERFDTIKENE